MRAARGAAVLLLVVLLATGLALGAARAGSTRLSAYPWVFLRGGQMPRASERLVTLAAVGDTNLGRGVDYRQALSASAGWLRAADLALANLECVVTEESGTGGVFSASGEASPGQDPPLEPYLLLAPPQAAGALAQAGIDLAGLANNHTADEGGVLETASYLDLAGVTPVGLEQPVFRQVKGIRLAFLAFNAVGAPGSSGEQPGAAPWEEESGLAAVRRASLAADAVIVSMHWGYEYRSKADPRQVETARALLAAGADLVIGHHPHVAQEVLVWRRADGGGRVAALSLGNFAFDQSQGETGRGLALRAFFDRRGLRALQVLPVRAGPSPRLDAPGGPLPDVLPGAPEWETVRFACQEEACVEVRAESEADPAVEGAGIFRAGTVELTGDWLPEEVRLADGRVRIFAQGRLSWESPPGWRVLDLATGDPDSDGRADLVLALEKVDDQGLAQSHPFVIGYRGGLYRTVWGGSPAADPLREVDLGDVNGDGAPELVVLEESRAGLGRALTVWRWHGWGFSLLWRSAYGQWEDVEVVEGGLRARKVK